MKVLFDHQIFNYVYGGASKYFVMLLKHLPRETWETSVLFSSNEYVKSTGIMRYLPYKFRGQTVLMELLNRMYTKKVLRQKHYDVFHQTNFGTFCLDVIGNKPMVTTYHDSNLSTFDPHPEIVECQRKSLKRADAIVCVSENTKKDLLKLFAVDERKVHVIYHGILRPDLTTLPSTRFMEAPYILFVGRRTKYKNFDRFVRVFAKLHKTYPTLYAVFTSNPFSKEELLQFEKLGIANRIMHVAASEDVMKQLYRDALFLAFPSFYEGFGMPILEAWSCGCPVVLSNASCFPEIAGDAALFFDPYSDDDMFCKFQRIITDSVLRQSIICKGSDRVKLFSWERCAEEHLKLYQSLLQ
jgi:glycosyltransferase involved in cell wall biosynthesis